jgi:hypothetical protein
MLLASVGLTVAFAANACSAMSAPTAPATEPAPTATSIPPSPTPVPPTAVLGIALSATSSAVPTDTGAPQPSISASPASLSEFKAVAEATAAATSYRMTVTATVVTQDQKGVFQVEVVKPDRLHTTAELGGQVFESITIGQDSYVRLAGKWTKLTSGPLPTSEMILSSDPQKFLAQIDSATQLKGTVTRGSIDQIGGMSCQEWRWTPADTNKTGGSMCIRVSDNLPLQFETADGNVVAQYTDWNAPIAIEPPEVE